MVKYNMVEKILYLCKIVVFVGILAAFGVLVAHKIDLITADLGRHIANGNILVNGTSEQRQGVLYTNYYSYTEPDRGFVNHHWGSGVVLYAVYELGGFAGVSIFFVLLCEATFALFYSLAIKKGGWLLATALALLFMPLMASRAEVRPEVFTYLFSGIFIWVLTGIASPLNASSKAGVKLESSRKWVILLPIIMLLWVNLHIGFVFGFFILGIFFLEAAARYIYHKSRGREIYGMAKIGVACFVAALANPAFFKGVIYPFQIFRQYGYMIVENQSIAFLEKLGITSTLNFGLYKAALAIAALSVIAVFAKWVICRLRLAEAGEFFTSGTISGNVIMIVFGILGYLGIRHFPSFAFLAMPVIAGNIYTLFQGKYLSWSNISLNWQKAVLYPLAVFVLLIGMSRVYNQILLFKPVTGLGLLPGVAKAAEFYEERKIRGPMFNNYDIGGYAIFSLGLKDKVFVDNRPEAYSVDFFEQIYKPMQTDNNIWEEQDDKYKFNSILFSHRDYTPWGQQFLQNRLQDSKWAVVYVDSYVIIMLKRNEQNKGIINKFEIAKRQFGIEESP